MKCPKCLGSGVRLLGFLLCVCYVCGGAGLIFEKSDKK